MANKTLECECIITLTSVRIEHSSEELTRRVVCPHSNEADFITKAGEYDLSVKMLSGELIESRLNLPI